MRWREVPVVREVLALWRRLLRRVPPPYVYGCAALLVSFLLLLASFHGETGIVDVAVATGEAPPGIAERTVPFNVTPAIDATLAVSQCGVEFHLLSDAEHATFRNDGTLPPSTLNCTREEARVQARVSHLVTVYAVDPNSTNVSYAIAASLIGTRTPYVLLSIPGALVALAATMWMSTTFLGRETERLRNEYRR